MKCPVWMGILLGLAIAAAGCSKSEQTSGKSGTEKDPAAADANTPAGSPDPSAGLNLLSHNVSKRKSLEGRWVLVLFDPASGQEIPAALLDIAKSSKDSNWRVNVRQFGLSLNTPSLKHAQANATSVRLVIEMAVQTTNGQQMPAGRKVTADILMELHDGEVRGTAQLSPLESILAQMVPTQLESIQELRPQQLPETPELMSDKSEKEELGIEKAVRFVKAHPDSPLTVAVYPVIFKSAGQRKLSEAAVEAEAERYFKLASRWGFREGLRSRIQASTALVASNYLPQVAVKEIDLALSQLTEETIPIWKSDLENLRQAAVSMRGLNQIHGGTPEEQAKGAAQLREHVRTHPYNPIFLAELARYDELHGKKDAALSVYSQLAVLPLFDEVSAEYWKHEKSERPSARESAAKMWKELHGGKMDGFDKYLDETYAKSMPKYTGKPVDARPRDPENRVVLCELFTGTSCPPCIAADVAFDHLLKTFGPTEFIGLQYHENLPKPDPLTNHDSESRFQFYYPDPKDRQTPTFTIAGVAAPRGGLLHQTSDVYTVIRQATEHFLAKKTSVKIRLKAEPAGGKVAVSAEADGSFSPYDPIRLRLALAEEHVALRGSNGIREHEMVVRSMPGGAAGVELKDGKLKYDGTIDLKAVKQQLDDDLTALEENSKTSFKTQPLDLAHLHLVAFVQNDQTHEVYQAAIVPLPTAAAAHASAPQATPSHPAADAKTSSPAVKSASVAHDAQKDSPKDKRKPSP